MSSANAFNLDTSANAFKLDMSKHLSLGKGLKYKSIKQYFFFSFGSIGVLPKFFSGEKYGVKAFDTILVIPWHLIADDVHITQVFLFGTI